MPVDYNLLNGYNKQDELVPGHVKKSFAYMPSNVIPCKTFSDKLFNMMKQGKRLLTGHLRISHSKIANAKIMKKH